MSWLQFLSQIAWPVVVLFSLMVFRRDLSALIGRVRKISGKGTTVDFADQLEKATESAEKLPAAPPENPLLLEAAGADPMLGIQDAWNQVKKAINKTAADGKVKFPRGRPRYSDRLKKVVDARLVKKDVMDPFDSLEEFYDNVRESGASVSLADARQFIEAAARVQAAIEVPSSS